MADREKRIAELVDELKSLNCSVAVATVDKTKGIVREEAKQIDNSVDGMIVEKADFGHGFQLYCDYKRDSSGKLKRLIRE